MILVIQCAAKEEPRSGIIFADARRTEEVMFVADPGAAPDGVSHAYARPDDAFRHRKVVANHPP